VTFATTSVPGWSSPLGMVAIIGAGTEPKVVPVGLTSDEVVARRALDGPNELPRPRRSPVPLQLVAQWTHFFAVLLWVGAGLAVAAGMPQLGVAIAVVVVINGVFAFVQEFRAERAADRLQDLLPKRVTVRRDGEIQVVDAVELVRGDVVLLGAGDRVCADLTLLSVNDLAVDTSTMTGESVPDRPDAGDSALAGTFVVEGEAQAVVVETGAATQLAGIAAMSRRSPRRRSPLATELDRLVRIIACIAVAVGVGFVAVSLLVGMSVTNGFVFGVGVTVALVPEGLLPTVTLSLAMGAKRMADVHALVRRLEAVETLGSTTFICTDKTGTLTCNQMAIVSVWTPHWDLQVPGVSGYEPQSVIDCSLAMRTQLAAVLETARRCSDGRVDQVEDGRWIAIGDPMEAAIDVLARRCEVSSPAPADRRLPFDPRRRRMSVVHGSELSVKGAPDSVLSECVDVGSDATAAVERYASAGWRTLAIARRTLSEDEARVGGNDVERDLELLAILAFEDPPRPDVDRSIEQCRRAGIRVAMITGDHPATALAIAREVGLVLPGSPVLLGHELPLDEQVLGALVDRDGVVVARVSPEHKLRIAAALRARGHVVAMTGDGVNDGPAMHEADIGIAMGRTGTDVARESADLVLLDDDFSTIVQAVEQGRSTFRNIRRFLTYHLTDNVAELTPFVIWALSGGRFPLAIGVLQVLALDIGTDMLPALALGGEPPRPGLLDQPPIRGHLMDRHVLRRAFGVLGPVEAIVEMVAFITVLLAGGWSIGSPVPSSDMVLAASGAAFTTVVLGQLAAALACRSSTRTILQVGLRGNPLLLGAIAAELGALALFLAWRPLADLLDHQPPTLLGFAVASLAIPAIIVADTIDKRRASSRRSSTSDMTLAPVRPDDMRPTVDGRWDVHRASTGGRDDGH
jgi:calcium-translocating P-type ATPase